MNILFETERLLGRRLVADDAKELVSIFGDEETMRYVGDSETLTEANCRYWIVDVTDKNFETRGYGMIGLVDKVDRKLVACSGIFHPSQQVDAEIMYWLVRDKWGNGYATEIVSSLVLYARQSWGVDRIIATIHPENVASQRVMAKTGFVRLDDRDNEDGSKTQLWENLS